MVQITYERPREKLQARGVAALSTAELLQVIIGSGSAHIPVARIARRVAQIIASGQPVDIATLLSLPGLGEANACRIVASIQLGAVSSQLQTSHFKLDTTALAGYKKPHILITTLNGMRVPIRTYTEALKAPYNSVAIARQISAKAISDNAEAVAVAVGYKNQSLEPSVAELSIYEDLKKVTQLLHISIHSFELTNKTQSTALLGRGS